jgi:glycosyltransferase involved in cell wall biosynthesis
MTTLDPDTGALSVDHPPIELLVVGPAGHRTGGIARYIAEQRTRLGDDVSLRVFDNATPNGSGWAWFAVALFRALVDLLRFPFRRPPDVVHVHTSHRFSFYLSSLYVLFAAYVWRRPVVLHVHGSSFDEFVLGAPPAVGALQSIAFSATDRVVVLSGYWREVLERRVPPEKLFVLPNAVDAAEYDPVFGADPPHVVFVSNHIERKGLPEFVEAVRTLKERDGGPFRVTIAGSGPLSNLAVDLADRYPDVEYRGYIAETEKRRLLDEGSIYVLPTHAEGLPIAVLEGMAGGNAIVSTDVGGIPDLVGEANGVVVPPGDVEQLTRAIERLVSSPERVRSMSEASRRRVEERYTWDSVVEELSGLYAEIREPR